MSTFLRTARKQRTQFHKLPVRGQFTFASGSPAGTWVKTGTRTYAAPNNEKHTFNGKVLPTTVTGRVKYWTGATFTAGQWAAVFEVYPSNVMTEADKRDW